MNHLVRFRRKLIVLGLLLPLVLAVGYLVRSELASQPTSQPLRWTPLKMDLPPGIRVFAAAGGVQVQPRAWYIDIDYNDKSLRAQPWLSTHPTGRETASAMAQGLGALVAINGGYFDMMNKPARTFSLVLRDRKTLVPNVAVVKRPDPTRTYAVTRSAFGIRANRTFDVAWVAQQGDQVWAYPKPVAHRSTNVAPPPTRESPAGGQVWDVVNAIGAGPTLISDGVIQDTYEYEVFFGAGFPNEEPYGRAAIGYTKTNHLILFSTDNQQGGQGLSLAKTALEMQRLGCIEAMNLDGGGSETLVVKGKTLNQPTALERPITSILAIVPNTHKGPNQTSLGGAISPQVIPSKVMLPKPVALKSPTQKKGLTNHFSVRPLPYSGVSRPSTLKQAIVSAIKLSNGQGLFYENTAIVGSKLSNNNFSVRFHRGAFSGDDGRSMKQKLLEVVFTRSNIMVKSFVKRTPGARDGNLCKAVAAACSYSFAHKYITQNSFQVEAEKEKPHGFDMLIYAVYPPRAGSWFHIGVTHDYKVDYYDAGS